MHTVHNSFNLFMPIAIGSDHAGFDYKEELLHYLQAEGFHVKDFGTASRDSVDYPDFAHAVANAVATGECSMGILFCGSANGVAITANKHQEIRAAICWNVPIAQLAREHNNANVICIPARYVSVDLSKQMIDKFIETNFQGGRHSVRVDKIACV
ncbi:ribose 5-phosphate isomerase B [Pollutibacter soli]|uniref:ribose 5-phosphate isomerase B n=1 Tax=Pollutibacter soli TaxID=3034157 RepID=UPI0030138EE3